VLGTIGTVKWRPPTLPTLLSLVVLAVVVLLWVRSRFGGDTVGYERITATREVAAHLAAYARSADGELELGWWRGRYFEPMVRTAVGANATPRGRLFWRDDRFESAIGSYRQSTFFEELGFRRLDQNRTVLNEDGTQVVMTREHFAVVLPWWLFAVATLLPLLARAAGRIPALLRRITQPRPGLCPQCGYDLRASPDRCPECGADVMRPR
jgi:hypothetical protein